MTLVLSPNVAAGLVAELMQVGGGPLSVSVVNVGGGGGSVSPLSSVFWVDKFNTAVGTPDGSIALPFKLIQDAVDAAPSTSTILICPGNYAAEAVNMTGAKQLSFVGVAAPSALQSSNIPTVQNIGAFNADATSVLQLENLECAGVVADNCVVSLRNVFCSGDVVCSGEPTWIDSHVVGDVSCAQLIAEGCQIDGTVTPQSSADPIAFDRCLIGAINAPSNVQLTNGTQVFGALTTKDLLAANATVVGVTTSTGVVTATCSEFQDALTARQVVALGSTFGAITLTTAVSSTFLVSQYASVTKAGPAGALQFDAWTNATQGAIPTNIVTTLGSPRGILTVTVPVLIAGALGTVAVSLVGSGLEGLSPGNLDQVVANEPTAGVVGGGAIVGCWVSALSEVTFKFLGPTTGGDDQFIVTRV